MTWLYIDMIDFSLRAHGNDFASVLYCSTIPREFQTIENALKTTSCARSRSQHIQVCDIAKSGDIDEPAGRIADCFWWKYSISPESVD